MQLQNRFLSDDEKRKIHKNSLQILSEIGAKYMSPKALKLLKQNGAKVDFDRQIAFIPEELVTEALKLAPKSFVLGARVSEFDFALPSSFSGYTLDGAATFAQDFYTGERRMAGIDDNDKALKVFDEMNLGSIVWPPIQVSDVPSSSSVIHRFIKSFISSTKHIQDELHKPEEVPYIIEAMACILNGEDEIKKRKIGSVTYCPIAPLVHDGEMCEAYMELGKYHVPVNILPMPSCGSTGPASLYSNIGVGNAEALSSIVLFQLANPGTPCIFGSATGSIDFRNGLFLEGSPEMVLQTGALGDMARFYNLPNMSAGCLSDAKAGGSQAVLEKMLTTLPLVQGGVDLINGIGLIESSQLLVLEQIIVDNEIANMCSRMKKGIDFSEDKNYFNDIKEVGPGGHYLIADSTVLACRSDEFFQGELLDKNTYESWDENGRQDMYSCARDKVEEILDSPRKNPLSDDTSGALEEIIRRAEKEL